MEKSYTTPAPIPKKIVFREKGSSSFIKKQHPWHNISAFETIYKFRLIAKHIKEKPTIQLFFHSSLKINNKTTKKNNS